MEKIEKSNPPSDHHTGLKFVEVKITEGCQIPPFTGGVWWFDSI